MSIAMLVVSAVLGWTFLSRVRPLAAQEDATHGSQRGDELPTELQRRTTRLQRIREPKRVLEDRAKDAARAKPQPAAAAKPDDKAQYNFTDPESRIMTRPLQPLAWGQ